MVVGNEDCGFCLDFPGVESLKGEVWGEQYQRS